LVAPLTQLKRIIAIMGWGYFLGSSLDLTKLRANYISKTERCIAKKGLDNSGAKVLALGRILMTFRATTGECAISTYQSQLIKALLSILQ
jgi:hypothetical protein